MSNNNLITYLQSNDPQFRKARLAALYSDFKPLSTLNPDGYQANILAWWHGLSNAALAGALSTPSSQSATQDLLSLTIDINLLRSLNTSEWGLPLALGTVFREAVKSRQWIEERDFRDARESVYTKRGWHVPTVGEVFGWGLRTLGVIGGDEDRYLEQGKAAWKVVVLENLEVVGRGVMKIVENGRQGRVERIYSKVAFKEEFEGVLGDGRILSERDLEVLTRFLERDKGVLSTDRNTVKFKAPNEKSPTPITTEDTTIASLKTLIKNLEAQTGILNTRIDTLTNTAKEAVAKKNRVTAMAALRSKKLAESTLQKRHATLSQLEEVFASIEQAADQIELVQVMEDSTKVLAGLNKEVGGVERVDDVLDNLREEMGVVEEVGGVIAEGVGQQIDEGEVDEEFEELERVEREKKEEEERIVREEKEKKEAAETMRKLQELEEIERKARENAKTEKEKEGGEESQVEDVLKRMSLDPTPQKAE